MEQVRNRGPTVLEWPVNLTLIWRFVRGSCVLIHTSVCQETKTAEIMLKILGATVQNLVERATQPSGYFHPCAAVSFAECNAGVFLFP